MAAKGGKAAKSAKKSKKAKKAGTKKSKKTAPKRASAATKKLVGKALSKVAAGTELSMKESKVGLSGSITAKKIKSATALASGPGAVNLELERYGSARKGIKAWVDTHLVVWLQNDRSALIPVSSGQHLGTVEVRGTPGASWGIRVSKPPGAVGGMSDTLPPKNQQPVIGNFVIDVP